MKKIIGIGLVLALFIPLAAQEAKPKLDYLFWTLAAANLTAGTIDMVISLHRYRRGEVEESNPIAKYIFDNCPWADPLYIIGSMGIIITASYFINKFGFKPLGHIMLGGTLLGQGYMIYINFTI